MENKFEEFETDRLILRKIADEDALILYNNIFNYHLKILRNINIQLKNIKNGMQMEITLDGELLRSKVII